MERKPGSSLSASGKGWVVLSSDCNHLGRRDTILRRDNGALPFSYQTVETTDVQKRETCPLLGSLTLDGKGCGSSANQRGSLLPTNRFHTALTTHQTSSQERLELRLGLVSEGQDHTLTRICLLSLLCITCLFSWPFKDRWPSLIC